jgi:integrase
MTITSRQRQQTGQLFRRSGQWFVRFYDHRVICGELTRKRLSKRLGACNVLSKPRAREEARAFLATINNQQAKPESALRLDDFIATIYFPTIERSGLRVSTIRGYRSLWKQLAPFAADRWLREIRTSTMQGVLDQAAASERWNVTSLRHAKAFLSGVFRLAIKLDFYASNHNPLRETSIPQSRRARETDRYSLEQVEHMLQVLPEPAATIVATAAYTGARRSELQGMTWENYTGDEIRITRSVWQGHTTEPKTEKSRASIPIIKRLATRLDMHRLRLGDPVSGPLFPHHLGRPVALNNVLRTMLPILKRNHIGWHGWHGFRRGLATNLYSLGVPDKIIQRILRHADVATTMACYVKSIPADVRESMEKLESELENRLLGTNRALNGNDREISSRSSIV